MEIKGIDVSYANGVVDWTTVKSNGAVDFAILRCGYGRLDSQKDRQFDRNYAECKRVKMPIGAYHYSYAKTVAEAKQEAEVVVKWLAGKQFEYPIFFDIEDKTQGNLPKQTITNMAIEFCSTLENAGFWAGVYSCDAWFVSKLDASLQDRYACWTARIENIKPTYCKKYGIWQNSWKGRFAGIQNDVDCDICYVDYPTMIKSAHKNGYGGSTSPVLPPLAKRKTYSVTFTDVSTKAECDAIAERVKLTMGYTNHFIEEEK